MDFDSLVGEVNEFLGATDIFVRGDQKLQRMRDLMAALGNPQNEVRAVHVAGTSGKTSTAYFAAEFLRRAGYEVGLTVSPHIEDVRERAIIGGEVLSKGEYAGRLAEFLELVREIGLQPSYFEFYMAFFYWLAVWEKLDFVVVETGLGGLHDGSNVISRPDKICIITDIGFDHMEILGESLAEIAEQKAGIIQSGNAVFMYEQGLEVMDVVRARCEEVGAKLTVVRDDESPDFQVRNAGLAAQALEEQVGLTPGDLADMQVPARAEEFSWRGKKVILDGAHNPQKLRAFADFVKSRGDEAAILVVSFGANKAASLAENLAILRELGERVVLASFQDMSLETNFRESLDFAVMEEAAKEAGFGDVEVGGAAESALERAAKKADELGVKKIIVVGSFFLASDARRVMMDKIKLLTTQ
ncbi:Mur ligase family protein [Candidatus Saccharibacteria bacterium]|nr:Mur ligase family protein [Candidatus Saccharibacteria bacterium]